MKQNSIVAGALIVGFFASVFAVYALVGFLDWIFRDPFNWVEDQPKTWIDPAIQICKDTGGIPFTSSWDGRLERCEIKNQ